MTCTAQIFAGDTLIASYETELGRPATVLTMPAPVLAEIAAKLWGPGVAAGAGISEPFRTTELRESVYATRGEFEVIECAPVPGRPGGWTAVDTRRETLRWVSVSDFSGAP